ncbi:hypothetical protein myaer87_43550 [Microcystis aeruginosa NIES-87]|nr:hypothetical protein myaer87_43550 [Microcystis aeruginosa NIES-87]
MVLMEFFSNILILQLITSPVDKSNIFFGTLQVWDALYPRYNDNE